MKHPPGWRLRRCVGSVAIVLAVCGGAVAPADAAGGHAPGSRTINTEVTVEVHRDGRARGRSALDVARTSSPAVSALNRAYAYAQCDDCRAVAVAFQVVLANRAPTDITADNAAIAFNEACERCETVAIAYQFVIVSPHKAKLTPAGHRRLAAIRFDLHQLSRSGRPATEIAAEAEMLAAEVANVLTTELKTIPKVDRRVRTDRCDGGRHPNGDRCSPWRGSVGGQGDARPRLRPA